MEKANETLNQLIERLNELEKLFSSYKGEVEFSLKFLGKKSPFFYSSPEISSFIEEHYNVVKVFNEIYTQYYVLTDYIIESPVSPETRQLTFFQQVENSETDSSTNEIMQFKKNIRLINNLITQLESKFEIFPTCFGYKF